MDHSAILLSHACINRGVQPEELVRHSDNGGPMKGGHDAVDLTQSRGGIPSFSRLNVSNDNLYSESLFWTIEYRPEFPSIPFESIEHAQSWIEGWIFGYNTQHMHRSIPFVTPDDRHHGREQYILANRQKVCAKGQRRNPKRWSKEIRNWNPVERCLVESRNKGPGQPRAPLEKGSFSYASGDNYLDARCSW